MTKKNNLAARNSCLGLTMGSGQVQEQVRDIELIIAQYYQSLKWIQGTAVDLQFQTQEIEHKI